MCVYVCVLQSGNIIMYECVCVCVHVCVCSGVHIYTIPTNINNVYL